MLDGLKQKVIVQPGGLIEVRSPDLPPGATVEVIVLLEQSTLSISESSNSAPRDQFQVLREQIIADGIPLLSDAEIEQEVAERRRGFRGY
jgi:hypothetical protein